MGSQKIQKEGCGALHNLACDDDSQARIAAAGGIDAVVGAMGAHTEGPDVQDAGCWALCIISANNADNQARIAAAGGIEAAVGAMSVHRGVADVQEVGCRVLCNLGTGPGASRDLQQCIKRANAEEAVRRAMASDDASADTRKAGQQLLDAVVNV